ALYIALKAVGGKLGDEVIVPAYDWYAATAAMPHCGAITIFADVDERTYTIEPNSVAERISSKTKAIIVTHLYGHPADIPELKKIADAHNVFIIEDAAQALGAACNGRKVGTWGDIACFSFGVGKILSCGEGGIIATNSEDLYERVISLCQHPLRQRWEGVSVNPFSPKATINPLATALLLKQFQKLEILSKERRAAFQRLNKVLTETNGFLLPVFVWEGCLHGCHRFSPIVKREKLRDKVLEVLVKAAIPACRGFPNEPLPNTMRRILETGQLCGIPFQKS
ncbi:MAG: DegT/DnrJ/EryC1/StrS family aminotransferase, partial [Acidobacteria bacterium]|nr:DegT/DnrJ/EryC1/StrS family aminotransferase [Acidobacteriota bacterium]